MGMVNQKQAEEGRELLPHLKAEEERVTTDPTIPQILQAVSKDAEAIDA